MKENLLQPLIIYKKNGMNDVMYLTERAALLLKVLIGKVLI
jgi:hypothetical protein